MKSNFRKGLYFFIFGISMLAFIFKYNADNIFSKLGDYYYKKNNQHFAIKFYERAINLGNKSYKLRENYVNSIINIPLTIENQEKLVKIIESGIKDSASMNAEYYIYNLKREINNKYPNNYIINATYNQKVLHWGRLPITYSFKNPYLASEEVIKSINDAFDEWERVGSGRLKFRLVKINPDIWIEFQREGKKNVQIGEKYVIAYTTPIISQDQLENMVIKFNLNDIDGNNFSSNQIYNTALHEIFHALGCMGHSTNKRSIMYMAKNQEHVINDSRIKIENLDKATLELLYKIKPDITNSDEIDYQYIPYLILGNNDNINFLKISEAKNYIRKAPTIAGGYIDLAQAQAGQKHYGEAVRNLENALRLANNNDTRYIVFYNLAVVYFWQNAYELALDCAQKAINISNEDEIHLLIAEIYSKQNQTKKAENEYLYLVNKNPQNIDYSICLANLYIKNKHYLKARNVLKKYMKNNPIEKNNPKLNQYKKLFI